jgi:translation initiation factor IF-3
MDYGKFKYEADIKAREARRNQANTVLKEIRFRLKIDDHDYETKKGHVERFLHGGDKVKVMIMFRGREQSRPEMGVRLLQRLAADVEKLGVVESMPKQDGRNMTMVLGPTRKKADAVSEQRKHAEEVNSKRITKSEARRAAVVTGEIPVVVPDEARNDGAFSPEAVAVAIAAVAIEEAALEASQPEGTEPEAPAAPQAQEVRVETETKAPAPSKPVQPKPMAAPKPIPVAKPVATAKPAGAKPTGKPAATAKPTAKAAPKAPAPARAAKLAAAEPKVTDNNE